MPEERLRRKIVKELWMNVNRNDVNVKACHMFAWLNKHIAEVRLSHAQIKSHISIYPE